MGSPAYGSLAYYAKLGRDAALKRTKRTAALGKKPRVRALLNAARRSSAAAQKSLEARLQRAEARSASLNASLTKRDQELTASELKARTASMLLQQERAARKKADGGAQELSALLVSVVNVLGPHRAQREAACHLGYNSEGRQSPVEAHGRHGVGLMVSDPVFLLR